MGKLTNKELEEAFDEVCDACSVATVNSSDGGKMPCPSHILRFQQRTYPVMNTPGFWDSELTHHWIDDSRMYALIEGVLEEFQDTELTITEYLHKIDPKIVYMTKEEFEEIPEL